MIEEAHTTLENYPGVYRQWIKIFTILQTTTKEIDTLLITKNRTWTTLSNKIAWVKEQLGAYQQQMTTIYQEDLTFSKYIVVDHMQQNLHQLHQLETWHTELQEKIGNFKKDGRRHDY